jgi:prepilin-type N-terminal cleavage/methylation domain-containing protein
MHGFGVVMSRRRTGFSLLELLIVMMIVGVVTALSGGRVHAIIVQQRVARAAMSVQSDLEAAFAVANRNRRPVRIAWDASKLQMQVTDRAGSVYYRRTPLGMDAYGFSASNVSFSRSPVEIYPNGLANDTLTIVITNESNTKRVRMSRAGMVRVE